MPKPYSLDLRERVVRFVDEGHSRHAAAAHFRVSVSFVVNLVKAFGVRGSLAPKPSGGRRHAKLEPHRGVSFGEGRREGRHHHAGAGGRIGRRHLREGRSRLAFTVAHPHRLSVQKTYGPPRLQEVLSRSPNDQSASTYPASEDPPGQDGDTRA